VGTVAVKPSVVELTMLATFGVLGFLMRRHGYPVAPVVVGLILGPMAEQNLRRALQMNLGDPIGLIDSPFAAILLLIAAVALVAPFAVTGLSRFKAVPD
jgi:putative tricarboxylic transport membrane protein